ncbi:hypothetical protein SAMN05192582_1007110 [Bacteroides ovatus]|uniref:Uncharacterized protein n=1 Tax=Bacteroides ovatus TaxID=28116 RepID=A0A1G8D7K6_BACOV|nr:hypothetical protein SAMN05192582_1007110 [Bacteroides ovatus]
METAFEYNSHLPFYHVQVLLCKRCIECTNKSENNIMCRAISKLLNKEFLSILIFSLI